ncbi:MAG: hypothetical protein L0I76_23125 [Pseudonocardia sp.]|nr:hypothetical protein [Pseudonocardia sp.]
MSMRIEWDTATNLDSSLLTADAALRHLDPETVDGTHVLVLGGSTGGAFAIAGDLHELAQLVQRLDADIASAQTQPSRGH